MKKLIPLITILLVTCGYAEAEEKVCPPVADIGPGTYAIAQDTVDRLFDAYRYYSRDNFARAMTPEATAQPGSLDSIENSYLSGTIIELKFIIDWAKRRGDTLIVKINWEKINQLYSNNTPIATAGRAELAFKEAKDGAWLLYQITGNNPF